MALLYTDLVEVALGSLQSAQNQQQQASYSNSLNASTIANTYGLGALYGYQTVNYIAEAPAVAAVAPSEPEEIAWLKRRVNEVCWKN